MTVTGNGKVFFFPYYGWLHNGAYYVREGTARLLKDDNHKEERKKLELEAQRTYVWQLGEKGLIFNISS